MAPPSLVVESVEQKIRDVDGEQDVASLALEGWLVDPASRDAVVLLDFFQAEDGIRDYKVTGVQTCALPISAPARHVVVVFRVRQPRLSGGGRQGDSLRPSDSAGFEIRRRGRRQEHRGSLLGREQHRSEEHTSELQSPCNLVCRLLLEKKKSN